VSGGKGPQQGEHAIDSAQQGLEVEEEYQIEHQDVLEVRMLSLQGKKKAQAKSSAQGISCTHAELENSNAENPRGSKGRR
jgi:hypothetical protein